MAEKRDYYEVLGVAKTASADEIKKAYRSAAMKWHPDRWVDGTDAEKKTAEEKFKEASEAYSVLSDPDKKAKYDQYGFAGVDGQGAPDFSGGFGNLNDNSGTGVAFTRDPATGEKKLMGEFLTNAQGEDVVAGVRTPMPIA